MLRRTFLALSSLFVGFSTRLGRGWTFVRERVPVLPKRTVQRDFPRWRHLEVPEKVMVSMVTRPPILLDGDGSQVPGTYEQYEALKVAEVKNPARLGPVRLSFRDPEAYVEAMRQAGVDPDSLEPQEIKSAEGVLQARFDFELEGDTALKRLDDSYYDLPEDKA